jgi:hypothetical protein
MTLPDRGGYSICHVCFWEDDGAPETFADRPSACNAGVTLNQARVNYAAVGACEARFVGNVSPPTSAEMPP